VDLDRAASAYPGRWVFPSAKNPWRHIGQHQRLHAAVVKRSKVSCVPYDFRHTFASRAANVENVPLPVLASIMGHANLRSIMKYVHVQQNDMDREILRLDSLTRRRTNRRPPFAHRKEQKREK